MRTCPFCSTENEAFFRFCLGCGADLDEAVGTVDEVAEAVEKPAATKAASPSDTVMDLPPITPEMLAEAARGRDGAVAPALPTPKGPRPNEVRASAAAKGARTSEVVPQPPKATELPARGAGDRAKTFDSGKQAKIASPEVHAVGQAQLDLAKKQPVGMSAPKGEKAEGPTKRAGSGPDLAPPVARGDRGPDKVSVRSPEKLPGEPDTQPRPGEFRSVSKAESRQTVRPGSKARLVVILEDGTDGSVLDLSPETTIIGREGADINFPHDDFLARHHAEFYYENGGLHLRPLESTNGVFVQVHQEVELDNGDVFRIGQQLLNFEILAVVASELEAEPRGQAIPLGSPIPEGAWGRLGQLIAPETMGSVYLLGGSEVYLGRERGDITFPGDGFVSGLHAQISQRTGRCFLKDLGSSNGTYLRLTRPAQVKKGTLVLAGQQLFRVEG